MMVFTIQDNFLIQYFGLAFQILWDVLGLNLVVCFLSAILLH